MGLIIRAAVENDAAELNRLNTLFNGDSHVTDEAVAFSIRNNKQEQVFVADYDGRLIGFCCAQLFKSFCYSSDYAEITELFIEEIHRRKGAASQLMQFAECYYADKNIGGFQLFTGADNMTAQGFYECLGYVKTNEVMYRKRK